MWLVLLKVVAIHIMMALNSYKQFCSGCQLLTNFTLIFLMNELARNKKCWNCCAQKCSTKTEVIIENDISSAIDLFGDSLLFTVIKAVSTCALLLSIHYARAYVTAYCAAYAMLGCLHLKLECSALRGKPEWTPPVVLCHRGSSQYIMGGQLYYTYTLLGTMYW